MPLKGKGKQVTGKAPATVAVGSSSGKRKTTASKSSDGGISKRKRKPSGVLQFFDEVAAEADSDFENDGDLEMEEEDEGEDNYKLENDKPGVGKSHHLPFLVKEEELSGDELEELIKERYGPGSEDAIHNDNPIECEDKVVGEFGVPIWKVKCMVGREQQMAFCLMQKYVELDYLETKLQIMSAFALEHVKGHVFLEADKLSDVMEACKGFCSIYPSRINLIPRNEIPNLLTSWNKLSEVSKGAWVRLKNGKYKGDLAKVVMVDDKHKQVTIKLVPRIDLQAIAKKFGGGVSLRLAAVPAPRLISSHELEAFRAHIDVKHDRQTGESFEVLDGMMLKDGYLYKKVSIGSLISWGVQPSSSELLMFTEVTKHTDVDLNWFSSIYGTHKKKTVADSSEDKTTNVTNNGYNLHDLVLFGRNNFGVIVAFEKDCFKILRGDAEGSEVMSVKIQDIKKSCDDKMFTASDSTGETIFIKDIVRTSVGPSEGREGIVRHMYRGKLFVQVENESENGGFFCEKSNSCQKTNEGKVKEKLKFSSIQSPTMPQDEENINTHGFNRGRRRDYDHAFSIGQSLRIREGQLKGYLCRVVGIYRSDVTVKLDSLGKLITVKDTSLAVPRTLGVNSSAHATQEHDNFGSREILSAVGTSGETSRQAEKSSWESMVPSFDRDSWQPFSTSTRTGFADNKKVGVEEDPWGSKLGTMTKNDTDDFGNTTDNWGKQPIPNSNEGQKSDPWASMVHTVKQMACGSGEALDGWDKATDSFTELGADSWNTKVTCADKTEDGWGKSSSSRAHEKSQISDNSIVTDDLMKSKISISDVGGSWDMEGGKKDNEFSWCSKGKEKLNSEEDTWSKPAKSKEKINQSFDDRTTVEDRWETAKFSISNAGGSWDVEVPKKDNACSLDSKGKRNLNCNDAWSQPAKFSISNAGRSWDMEGAKKDNACSLDNKGKESLNNNDARSQTSKSQEMINQSCDNDNTVAAGWEMSKFSTNNAGGSWNMEGAKKDSACSRDSIEKGNNDSNCWSQQATKPQRNNESCHDQTNGTDGWEKSKLPIDQTNACSWDSKGKVNSEDVWSKPANSQKKVDQICDASAGCWTQSDKNLHEKQKVRSEEDSWGKIAKPQVKVNDVWCASKAEKVNWDSGNGSQVGGLNKNSNWGQTSALEIDGERNDEDDGTTQSNWGRGRGRDGSKGSGGFNEVDAEQTWSSGTEGRSRRRGHCGQFVNSRDDFHVANTSSGQVHSWQRDNGDSQTTVLKNGQSCDNESIAKDQTSTWANEKSSGKDKWSGRGDGKNDDEPGWNTVKASDTKQISGCIDAATTKTEGNWDKARTDEAFDISRKSSGIPNWGLAESSAKTPKDVSSDKVSNWTTPEDGTDKSNSCGIKDKSKIAADCWGKTNYQQRKIDDADNWASNSSQIKESSTFPILLPLAGMAKDSPVQVSSWEKAKDSSNTTETGGWNQARSFEHSENDNWNRGNSFGEAAGSDWSDCWKKSSESGFGFGRGRGRGQNNWDTENNQNNSSWVKPMGQGGYQRSSWGRGRGGNADAGGDQQRPWKLSNDSDGSRGSGWGRGRGGNDDAGGDKQRHWKPRNDYDVGKGSGWGRGRGGNAAAADDQQKQWNRQHDSDVGWGRGRGRNNDAGGNQQTQWNRMNDSDHSRGFRHGRFGSHDKSDGGWHGRGGGRGNNLGNNNGAGGRGRAGFFSSGRNNDQGNFGDESYMGNSGSKWGQDENKGSSTNWSKDQVVSSDNSKIEEKWGNANAFSSSQFSAWSNQPGQAKDLKVEGTWKNSQDAPVAGDEGSSWGKAVGSWRKKEGSGSMGGW